MTNQFKNPISFISANFVARELNYNMSEGWMQGDTATQNFYKPIKTFAERFGKMLSEVSNMGFQNIDLWGAHLHPDWASEEHFKEARELLAAHHLHVNSLAAWCGSPAQVQGFCRVANAVGASIIAGGAPVLQENRQEVIAILKNHNIKLAIENHPEKTSQELLYQIADGANGFVGAAADTGWWATQNYDAPSALRELKHHLLAVHLKDVKAAGAHDSCCYGQGVANIATCVQALREIGYAGVLGIEHEPEHHDPTEEVVASKKILEAWL